MVVVVLGTTDVVVVGRGTVVPGRTVVVGRTVAGARGSVVGGLVGKGEGLSGVTPVGGDVTSTGGGGGGGGGTTVDTEDLRFSSSTDAV